MIDFYTAGTGNGRRPALMLEECGLAYTAHKIDLMKGEGKSPEYQKINPVGAIPAIVDRDGPGGRTVTLAQSGAILLYLAEKTGKFWPADPAERAVHLQWLLYALTDVAPTSSAVFYASRLDDKSAQGLFEGRLLAMFGHVDRRLGESEYLAGGYGLADMALYPVYDGRRALIEAKGGLPNVARWAAAVGGRPAVQKGMAVA
ncbi:glutathione S-transferase [Thalassobaculum fulvum]|uniref:Glutathione S-transferase n=1 Tax=Thalassobaculum fulvum TaxID=1633335 RepID=A0A918XTV5_9PROT|nr:glutathione S-transferase family protein [Thalassobaculum fulvum]GHD54671.1 glutathione S-transferase [Thalassobaculum fulvum]